METTIRHCKHIDPITHKRKDSCPLFHNKRKIKPKTCRVPSEEELKIYCIPMKEISSCFDYED